MWGSWNISLTLLGGKTKQFTLEGFCNDVEYLVGEIIREDGLDVQRTEIVLREQETGSQTQTMKSAAAVATQ